MSSVNIAYSGIVITRAAATTATFTTAMENVAAIETITVRL